MALVQAEFDSRFDVDTCHSRLQKPKNDGEEDYSTLLAANEDEGECMKLNLTGFVCLNVLCSDV